LARRQLEGGRLPQGGGVRPQLLVTVDLASLLGPGGLGGEAGGGWPLEPETCRRLACDGAVTRVLVSRQPPGHPDHGGDGGDHPDPHDDPGDEASLAAHLQAAATRLPATLGGRRPSRWRSAAPAESSPPPNGSPWWSATVAARFPAATAPRPGARPIIWSTGCMAAPPTYRTWPWCAGPIIGRSMRGAGGWAATPTGTSPPPHRTEDSPPRHEPATPTTANRNQPATPFPGVHESGWRLTRGPDGRLVATPARPPATPSRRLIGRRNRPQAVGQPGPEALRRRWRPRSGVDGLGAQAPGWW
jgi:hypothetical protein